MKVTELKCSRTVLLKSSITKTKIPSIIIFLNAVTSFLKLYFISYTLLKVQRFSSLKERKFLVTVQTENRDVNNDNTFSFYLIVLIL